MKKIANLITLKIRSSVNQKSSLKERKNKKRYS